MIFDLALQLAVYRPPNGSVSIMLVGPLSTYQTRGEEDHLRLLLARKAVGFPDEIEGVGPGDPDYKAKREALAQEQAAYITFHDAGEWATLTPETP